MLSIGIDIGTTTISGLIIDSDNGDILKSVSLSNDSFITTLNTWEKLQDTNIILKKVMEVIDCFLVGGISVGVIGLTGQMHGIVYTDIAGIAASPLYTWQDQRGNLSYHEKHTYCSYISEVTGYNVAAGYGMATHLYNVTNNLVPDNAIRFCTIQDYIGMILTGRTKPLIHVSNAASFGMFRCQNDSFDCNQLKSLGIDTAILPDVTSEYTIIGEYKSIPVSVAIGDNQASFLGSVKDIQNSILVNVGTGSQISIASENYVDINEIDTRPFAQNKYLFAGSSLCGGRAYATLENFFRQYAVNAGLPDVSQYEVMEKLMSDTLNLNNKLDVSTAFSGTRKEPNVRGYIKNISINNFTPEYLVCGVLSGIANELYDMYLKIKDKTQQKQQLLIGSGNGIRKNKTLQKIFSEVFEMKILIPLHNEEASFGTALFALASANCFPDIESAQRLIKYE